MGCNDMLGNPILIGDRVVLTSYNDLAIGRVTRHTKNSVIVKITRPNEYNRQVSRNLSQEKILMINKQKHGNNNT